MALANSRSLAKYNMDIDSSLRSEKDHLYSMLPVVSAGYSASMNYLDRNWGFVNPIDTLSAGVTLEVTQKIFEGGKSFIRKALNSIATESVRKGALAEYFNVLASADDAYYAVLESAAALESAESSLQSSVAGFAIAEIRQASGMINHGEFLRAMADKESMESSRNQARRRLALNISKLKTLTGAEGTFELEQIDFNAYEELIQFLAGISDEHAEALYERFWKVLAASNPSLARSAMSNERAEKNLTLAKRDYAPTISASVISTGFDYTTAGGFGTRSGGGISIRGSIPLDFWVMNNRIAKSKNDRDSAALDYINAEVTLENDLQSTLLDVFSRAETILSSRRSLDYSEKLFEFAMERYRLLQSSVSDLGDASTRLIDSRNRYISAHYDFLRILSRLRSMGAVDDEEKLIAIFLAG